MKSYFIYIIASKKNGTIYIGVTNDLIKRVYQHKNDLVEGFSKKYKTHNLVYYEVCSEINSAIKREKTIKAWKRKWKVDLIESKNNGWRDLYKNLI